MVTAYFDTNSNDRESNARHRYFLSIIERVLATLRQCPPLLSSVKKVSNQGERPDKPVFSSTNLYYHLEEEDADQDDDEDTMEVDDVDEDVERFMNGESIDHDARGLDDEVLPMGFELESLLTPFFDKELKVKPNLGC